MAPPFAAELLRKRAILPERVHGLREIRFLWGGDEAGFVRQAETRAARRNPGR